MKYLIVGLGNPGGEYEETRHNIGFKVVEQIARGREGVFKTERLGDVCQVKHRGRTLVLLKPNTYMNLSGKAVRYWLDAEKIPIERLLVVTDDLALPFGTLRLRGKGSDGGHNGLKDIQAVLGTTNYARLRFGIGAEFSKGRQVDYVLGEWSAEEKSGMKERMERCEGLAWSFATAGLGRTMNEYNNT